MTDMDLIHELALVENILRDYDKGLIGTSTTIGAIRIEVGVLG